MKQLIPFFALLLSSVYMVQAQEAAVISCEEAIYDFGTIVESDGLTSHTFVIKNTGDAALVITRVTASCGCTTPEWTKIPIEPGTTGDVRITYDPKGRPGPFRKKIAVYSNGKKGAFSLTIKGTVVKQPVAPPVTYSYKIGDLSLQSGHIAFNTLTADETKGGKITIKNEGKIPVNIRKGKVPSYLTVDIRPERLGSGETGEITILWNAPEVKRKGRILTEIPVILDGSGKKGLTGIVEVSANIIDNFSGLSAADKANAPVLSLSVTLVDFGKTEGKSGFMSFVPFIGGKASETVTVTNTGKSNLSIYSITSDTELVDVLGGKKELKPGASSTYKITVRTKDIVDQLESFITVVCNDPNGPVRLIKVTAEN
ncbi:MAG: DUF1573 domain-containing protein [Tannerellaceae bacterium]|nr:DUF1573 domain-containing protein [Tannerellaceae bacterium]